MKETRRTRGGNDPGNVKARDGSVIPVTNGGGAGEPRMPWLLLGGGGLLVALLHAANLAYLASTLGCDMANLACPEAGDPGPSATHSATSG